MEKGKGNRTGAETILPYDNSRPKGEQIEEMFDSIAPAYDFMNRAMTFGMHVKWRDKALSLVSDYVSSPPGNIIDLATGTGDVAFALLKKFPGSVVVGCDLSSRMLEIAEEKRRLLGSDSASRLRFERGDCLNLPYSDNTFDLVTIAYGVRNFENLKDGLSEIFRVLKPGGSFMIIELSRPRNFVLRSGYDLYSRVLIPLAGRLASGDNRAYSYLPQSIKAMPSRSEMKSILEDIGFKKVSYKSLTMGVVTIYLAQK